MNFIFHEFIESIGEVYINDIVVKSIEFDSHLVDLHMTFEKMHHYDLKMNPRKCAFGVSSRKFLGFIIYEQGIEVDPDQFRDIQNLGAPTCKLEMLKFLSKVNYLRRFISNIAMKIDVFTHILQLKNNADFTWV
jgi:hypothetical protein